LDFNQSLLEFIDIPKQPAKNSLLQNTANTVEWIMNRAVRSYNTATYLEGLNLLMFFFLFSTVVAFVQFPHVMQQQTLGKQEIQTLVCWPGIPKTIKISLFFSSYTFSNVTDGF